jgi:hypothetical protein
MSLLNIEVVVATRVDTTYVKYFCTDCNKEHQHGSEGRTTVGEEFLRGRHCEDSRRNIRIVIHETTKGSYNPRPDIKKEIIELSKRVDKLEKK